MIQSVEPRRIHRLADHIVNQIAAGEVIERPASVVKELVENALDAGAKQIQVELEEGGRRLIRVSDDGAGIHHDDLPLAVASHATSKLRHSEDLQRIDTLGFRGEALASIASVAELEVVSRPRGADAGERVEARDGRVERRAPEMIAPGTRVTVRNLFYDIPARRRFLKNDSAELARAATALESIALARPEVGFSLLHNGKTVFRHPAAQEPRARVAEVVGEETSERLLALESGDARIAGWSGRPDLAKRDSHSVHTFVNLRGVRDSVLLHAVRQAYQGFQVPGH